MEQEDLQITVYLYGLTGYGSRGLYFCSKIIFIPALPFLK
jgi:hypothetical protein